MECIRKHCLRALCWPKKKNNKRHRNKETGKKNSKKKRGILQKPKLVFLEHSTILDRGKVLYSEWKESEREFF